MSDGDSPQTTRRGLMAGAIAAVGLGGYLTGSATAQQGTPSGQVGTSAEPAQRMYTDVLNLNERTSDPSNADNGALWYNSDA